MDFQFDSCLIPRAEGENSIYQNCCCNISCVVTNISKEVRTIISTSETQEFDWTFDNLLFNGLPLSLPLVVPPNATFTISFDLCANGTAGKEALTFDWLILETGLTESFSFFFNANDGADIASVSSLDFGNVAVGTTSTLYFSIFNSTACCNTYDISADCSDCYPSIAVSDLICTQDSQNAIGFTFAPSVEGEIASCNLVIQPTEGCVQIYIPVTGKGVILDPVSDSLNRQKNKVDQTSILPACSPRTINNQCNTGQVARSAITSRAQTITRSAGGAGRGKGFSK